jgi:FAD/FMN-containing dehydrogenase
MRQTPTRREKPAFSSCASCPVAASRRCGDLVTSVTEFHSDEILRQHQVHPILKEIWRTEVVALKVSAERGSSVLTELRSAMRGQVVAPEDQTYDAARQIWNGAVDHRPALLAICENVDDVQAAVHAARKYRLPLSVLGGGYDWAGRSVRHQGLVIDLSAMKQVVVDAQAQTATVQGGATAGDVVAAAAPHGLTAVVGTIGKIGMAGFTLAGGYGPLSSRFGLGLDNLIGVELVLADGRRIKADASENVDLSWALRGGGGNLGVVTSMHVRLHPVREVLAGKILFPWSDARPVLSGYAKAMASAPDELAVTAAIVSGPDGSPAVLLAPYWSGDMAQGQEIIAGLQRLGSPLMGGVGPMACADVFGLFEPNAPSGRRYAQQTRWLRDITPETITDLIEIGSSKTSTFSLVAVQSFHGAASRVPLQATAFGLRRKHFLASIVAAWDATGEDDDAKHRQWARDVSQKLASSALPGGYPNLLGPDEHAQIDAAYGGNINRLLDVKRRFDPENVFTATPLPVAAHDDVRPDAQSRAISGAD